MSSKVKENLDINVARGLKEKGRKVKEEWKSMKLEIVMSAETNTCIKKRINKKPSINDNLLWLQDGKNTKMPLTIIIKGDIEKLVNR